MVSASASGSAGEVFLEIREPPPGSEQEAGIEWAEVAGYVSTGESPYLDVFIAIDLSASTLVASGDDIDGDGRVGRTSLLAYPFFSVDLARDHYRPAMLSTDPGDTVAWAQIHAARRFVESVDLSRVRIGVLTFAASSRVRIHLTSDREELIRVIDDIGRGESRRRRNLEITGTNMAHALATGGAYLLAARAEQDGPPRRMELLMLSDGLPSRPFSRGPEAAVATAQVLQERDVQVHFFPLGSVAVRNAPFFEFVDDFTGSRHTKVGRVGEIVERLAETHLDRMAAFDIVNRTSGVPARALRVFADGSFDAVVPLVPGENEVSFHVVASDGQVVDAERVVSYVPSEPRTAAEAARRSSLLEAFEQRLRGRRTETELLMDLHAARELSLETQHRLEIEADARERGRGRGRSLETKKPTYLRSE